MKRAPPVLRLGHSSPAVPGLPPWIRPVVRPTVLSGAVFGVVNCMKSVLTFSELGSFTPGAESRSGKR